MSLRKILKYPNPLLRIQGESITEFNDELQQLVNDMAQTMYDAPGIGLAAPQIGVSKRVVVMDHSEKDEENQLIVLINPKIMDAEGSQVDEEGCLSVVDLNAKVKRFAHIKVQAQDMEGNTIEFEADDWFARVIQHEVDHLNGVLFLDRLSSLKRALYKKKRKKQLQQEEKEMARI